MVEYLLSNEQFFLIIMLFVWVIILELTHSTISSGKSGVGLSYLQFGIAIPLILSLCANAYLQSIAYGYMVAFVVVLVSAYYVFIGLGSKIK